MPTTYQLLITLQDIQPAVRRRIQVDSSIKLSDLHKVLQTAMGWTDSHLHQFIKDGKNYTLRTSDNDYWDKTVDVDYKKIVLGDLLINEGDSMDYNYDYGDDWMHTIELERIETTTGDRIKPTCLDGARCCPPEDVGGVGGYEELLSILKNPKHPEYQDYLDWLGKPFHPEFFDAAEITIMLRKRNYGRLSWEEISRENFFGNGSTACEEFEGLTPAEMNILVGAPYSDLSPIQLKPLLPEILTAIPILNLSKFLLKAIATAGEQKLTPKGNLPVKLVMEMFQTGFITPRFFRVHPEKPTMIREDDDNSFTFTRALLEQAGLIKKRNNKLSITKTGLKLLADDASLFKQLLLTCSTQFNWSKIDWYENYDIGVYGFAYVLKLMNDYGSEKRLLHFYAEKYFKAFPWLVATRILSYYDDPIKYSNHCFEFRALEILMTFFGFTTVESIPGASYGSHQVVVRTELYERLFEVRYHSSGR